MVRAFAMADITQRKQAEQSLRESEQRLLAVVNTAVDAIITIDRKGAIQSFNPAAERMFGYLCQEVIGRNVSILMPAPYCDEHDRYMSNYFQTGKPKIIGIGREVVARRKDGSIFPIDLAVSEIDQLGLFTGLIRDISERKELQKQVLEIAVEEQRRIGQDLHDGIGQELTGLAMIAEGLVEAITAYATRFPKEDCFRLWRDIAKKISDGLGQALANVRQLSSGLVPVDVDAEGLMAALSQLAATINQYQNISCAFECAERVEVHDNFAATHLYRIAQEAISNALKHAKPTQIRVALSDHAGPILLEVEDNGVGMQDIGSCRKGTGMRIMEYRAGLIGATLKWESAQGGGTRVVCSLFPT